MFAASDNICDTPDQRDMEAPPPCDEAPPSYWESLPPDWESLPPDRESLPPDWESLPPDRESLPPYVINKPIKLHQVPPGQFSGQYHNSYIYSSVVFYSTVAIMGPMERSQYCKCWWQCFVIKASVTKMSINISFYYRSMNYYPLFRVRSWNNGVHCMSFYILIAVSMGEMANPLIDLSFSRPWDHSAQSIYQS